MHPSHDSIRREISSRDLFRAAFKKWYLILIVGLICCAAAVFITYRRGAGAGPDSGGAEAYEEALAAYERDYESLTSLTERTEALLTEKRAYIASSLLTAIDPARVGKAVASFVITPSAQSPAAAEQLADAYASFFTYGVDWTETAAKEETEPAYLAELVSTTPLISSSAAYAASPGAQSSSVPRGTVTVTVVHADAAKASELMDVIFAQLAEESGRLEEVLGAHTLTLAERYEGYYADTAIGSRSENLLQETYTLSTNLERLTSQLAKLKKPAASSASHAVSKKTLMKYGAAGLLAGALAALLVLMAGAALSGKVLSASELTELYGMKKLALITGKGARAQKAELLAAAELLKNSGTNRPLLLTGDISAEDRRRCAEGLNAAFDEDASVEIEEAGLLGENAENIRALGACGGVILLEKIGTSRHAVIADELDLIAAGGKEVIGVIVLSD